MLVRTDSHAGEQSETVIPDGVDRTTSEYADLAWGLLAVLPGLARIRIFEPGRSFMDAPIVDVSRFEGMPTPEVTDAVLDVATGLLLGEDEPEAPPAWIRPYTGSRRPPATGTLPPV